MIRESRSRRTRAKDVLALACVFGVTAFVPAQSDVAQHGLSNEDQGAKLQTLRQMGATDGARTLAGVSGSLAVRAVQATPDGPPITNTGVELQLLHSGAVIASFNGNLDEHGVAVFDDLPIVMGVTPVVRVQYDDVTYQQPGELMDASHTEQIIEVPCYETTEVAPQWRIAMRHIMVGNEPGGLRVAEVVVIENPDHRTWIGVLDDSGRRATCEFALPANAQQVAIGQGFHDWCCTTFEPGRLINHLPLMPETTELHFRYFVPGEDGTAAIDVVADAETDQVLVVIPDELQETGATGLRLGGVDTYGEKKLRFYEASAIRRGGTARIELAGLAGPGPSTGRSLASSQGVLRIVVGAGAGILVLGAIVILLFRRTGGLAPQESPGG